MTTGPRTNRAVSVDILTSSYRVVGKVFVSNTGVMGLMNDITSSFMEIHEAKLARIHMPTKLADKFKVVRLVKSQVHALCLGRREDLGPQGLARGGYATVTQYSVRMASQVYEMEGILEWTGRFNFKVIMAEGTRDFVPLYAAQVNGILIPALKVNAPAILFNRKKVDWLGLLKQREEG